MVLAAVVGMIATRPARGDQKDQLISYTRPSTNISDIYMFPSPSNSNNVVVAMNVSPGLAAGTAPATAYFDSGLMYQMKFDSKIAGEAVGSTPVENIVMQFLFTIPTNGLQQVYVYGPSAPTTTGTNNPSIGGAIGAGNINTSFQATTASGDSITVFAGERADPFFFDYNQFYGIFPNRNKGSTAPSCLPGSGNGSCPQGFNNPGTNSQATTNVLSIIVEMPKSLLQQNSTGPKVAYWATTSSPTGN
jgi:hypothetical protein